MLYDMIYRRSHSSIANIEPKPYILPAALLIYTPCQQMKRAGAHNFAVWILLNRARASHNTERQSLCRWCIEWHRVAALSSRELRKDDVALPGLGGDGNHGYTTSPEKPLLPMQDFAGKRLSIPEKLVGGFGVHPSAHPNVSQPSRPRDPLSTARRRHMEETARYRRTTKL
jgi:hypothetical protein